MTPPILVTGGTGTLGRLVVARLKAAGQDVRVLTRRSPASAAGVRFCTGDLRTGAGIEAAVRGSGTVVHCASSSRGDVEATENLLREASSQPTPPALVYISIVGVDRIPLGYYRSKLATERVIAGSGLPWTTLRATQFHDLVLMAAGRLARLPVVPVPAGFRFQPIDADDVAERLVDLAAAGPAGRVADLGGPQVYGAAELVRGYLRATRRPRRVLPVRLPGRTARAFRTGANLAPDHAEGRRTWEDFLAERAPGEGPAPSP